MSWQDDKPTYAYDFRSTDDHDFRMRLLRCQWWWGVIRHGSELGAVCGRVHWRIERLGEGPDHSWNLSRNGHEVARHADRRVLMELAEQVRDAPVTSGGLQHMVNRSFDVSRSLTRGVGT